MERLTEMFEESGEKFACLPECKVSCIYGWTKENSGCRCDKFAKILDRLSAIEEILGDDYDLDRLKELAQADREGRCAVLLPCKVGDKLYKISENGVKEVVVQSIVFMLSHTVNHLTVHVANERGAMTEIETKDFGKIVFLTSEEAEAALEKMKEGEYE